MNTDVNNQLKNGGIVVMPTDTIYGIVGSALNPETVEKIYQLRKRASNKPFIILVSSLDDLKKFDIQLTDEQKEFLEKIWPNPVSVVLPCEDEKFKYLHRGTKSLAFRIPKNRWLLKILEQTGPLVAPSANFEGEKPSETIKQAKKYFGNNIAFYLDGGRVKATPSTIIEVGVNSVKTLRQGSFKIRPKLRQEFEKMGYHFDLS